MSSAQVVDLENSLDSMQNKPEVIEKETVVVAEVVETEKEIVAEASATEEAVEKVIESSTTEVVEPSEKDSEPCFDNQKTLKEIDGLLKASKLDEAVELYGTYLEDLIGQFEGNSTDSRLAEEYARYGGLLLKLAIRNNDQNLLSSNSAAAADVNEASAAALLQTSLTGGNKKKLIDLGADDDEEEEVEEQEEQEPIAEEEEESSMAAFDQAQAEAEGEGEEDDFTIAWENLDVARLLFERRIADCQDEQERSVLLGKLARVLQDLGDLCLEDENFKQAVSDYKDALKAYGEPQPGTLRDIAGIYFNLALALEFVDAVGEAKKMYIEAQKLLQQRRSLITDASNEEAAELDGLIAEIGLKIEDMDGENGQAALAAQMNSATSQAALQAAQSLSGTVNDLSGMIKKRKPENVDDEKESKQSKH